MKEKSKLEEELVQLKKEIITLRQFIPTSAHDSGDLVSDKNKLESLFEVPHHMPIGYQVKMALLYPTIFIEWMCYDGL